MRCAFVAVVKSVWAESCALCVVLRADAQLPGSTARAGAAVTAIFVKNKLRCSACQIGSLSHSSSSRTKKYLLVIRIFEEIRNEEGAGSRTIRAAWLIRSSRRGAVRPAWSASQDGISAEKGNAAAGMRRGWRLLRNQQGAFPSPLDPMASAATEPTKLSRHGQIPAQRRRLSTSSSGRRDSSRVETRDLSALEC